MFESYETLPGTMGPNETLCSSQPESYSSCGSREYHEGTGNTSEQYAEEITVSEVQMNSHSDCESSSSLGSVSKPQNFRKNLRLTPIIYEVTNQRSQHTSISSICSLNEAKNTYTYDHYWDSSQNLSHKISQMSVMKAKTSCSISSEDLFKQDIISTKKEFLLTDNKQAKAGIISGKEQSLQSILFGNSTLMFHSINPKNQSVKSAPQLSINWTDDPIQRFHARHYDKLLEYMAYVHSYLPIPVAVTVEKCSGPKLTAYLPNQEENVSDTYGTESDLSSTLKNSRSEIIINTSSKQNRKSLNRASTNMILHFACNRHHPQCLYPGSAENKYFSVNTRHFGIWMQLLVLEVQYMCQKPVHVNHPSMTILRILWTELINNSLRNLSYAERDPNMSQTYTAHLYNENNIAANRSVSVCGTLTRHSEIINNQGLQRGPKPLTWNSLRFKSMKKPKKQPSFFIIATQSYPKSSDHDILVEELKEAGYFELFQMRKPSKHNEISDPYPTRTSWDCFVCGNDDATWRNYSEENARISGIKKRVQKNSPVKENVFNLHYELNAVNPRLIGKLKFRHIKRFPRALAWLSSWKTRDFRLENGFIAWKECDKKRNKSTRQSLTNFIVTTRKLQRQTSLKTVTSPIKCTTGLKSTAFPMKFCYVLMHRCEVWQKVRSLHRYQKTFSSCMNAYIRLLSDLER
ncbi:unnamed protein product [Heterobilharzia americana]|nr:unnamed protein product [Heterobilharzia americana]